MVYTKQTDDSTIIANYDLSPAGFPYVRLERRSGICLISEVVVKYAPSCYGLFPQNLNQHPEP